MAWNKPTSGTVDATSSSRPTGRGKMPRLRKGILAGAIVVLGAGIAAWFLTNGEATSSSLQKKERGLIKEVAPAAAPTNTAVVTKRKTPKTREEKLKYYRDKYGDNLPENLKATVYFLEHPPKPAAHHKGQFEYLHHPCERQIASFLTAEPGALFIIKPTFDSRFDRDFQNAFVDRIEILDTDSDEVKQIKQEVEAAKKELAAACREDGRLPSELMTEHAANMYELGQYRQNLEAEMSRVRDDPNCSDEDIGLFVEAANKMLKAKGLNEIAVPNLLRRSARLKMLANRRAKEAQQKANAPAQ